MQTTQVQKRKRIGHNSSLKETSTANIMATTATAGGKTNMNIADSRTSIEEYPNCTVTNVQYLGDGKCDNYANFNSIECGYDAGDCIEFNSKYPNCTASNPDRFLGNGFCDGKAYNTEECKFDGYDCIDFNAKYPNCTAPQPTWIGDGQCTDYLPYNTEECGFDGGDCLDNYPGKVLCSTTEGKAIIGIVVLIACLGLSIFGFNRRRYVIDAFAYFSSSVLRKK